LAVFAALARLTAGSLALPPAEPPAVAVAAFLCVFFILLPGYAQAELSPEFTSDYRLFKFVRTISPLNSNEETKMAGEIKQVGERTFRETFGRYFEDFQVGDIYQHRPGRTITQYDNVQFTLMTMNTHPMHFDEEYAKHSEFGRCIVCSPLTVALMVGMSVTDVSQKAIANLGWNEIKLTHPLFAGDTLYAESEVLDKRESKSRPNAGIVSVKTIGLNQDNVKVCEFGRTMLIMKRTGNDVETKANY
jgi:acyl dehydratase